MKKKISKKLKKFKKKITRFTQQKWFLYSLAGMSLLMVLVTCLLIFNPKLTPNSDIYEVSSDETGIFANSNPDFDVFFGEKNDKSKQWIRFESETENFNPFDPNYQGEKKNIFSTIAGIFKKDEKLGIEMSLSSVKLSETSNETIVDISGGKLKVEDILGTDRVETSTELLETGRMLGEYDSEQNISKETILNQDVWKGVDLEYQILEGVGVKEEIIIRSLESYMETCANGETDCEIPLNEFIFDLQLDEGVELHQSLVSVSGNPSGTYYFTDSKGNYLAHFLPCFAFDAGGNKTTGVTLDIEETDVENIYKIQVILDIEWMLSAERIFPIHIDPSIVHDDSADFDAGILNRLEDATGPKVQLVEQELTADEHTVGLWHMNEADSGGVVASGGTVAYSGGYVIHTFSSSGTLTVSSGGYVDVLVVAGGGGGGYDRGGGGGAGGMVYQGGVSVSSGNVTVTVGNGGSGSCTQNIAGSKGGNSSFGGYVSASGGGGGGSYTTGAATSGGSGGGGSSTAGNNTPGSGTSGQGNAGGVGQTSGSYYGGGGGGRGSAGGTPNGGNGQANSITGTSVTYAGGGGGRDGLGGTGGGGDAGTSSSYAEAGTDGLGGGGGGGYGNSTYRCGADGGNGIVIIRYLNSDVSVSDSSGQANNGTSYGASVTTSGKLNNARYFNGSSSYIEVPDSQTLRVGSPFLTFEAWVKPTASPAEAVIVNKENSYEWAIKSGTLQFAIRNTSPGWAWVNTEIVVPLNTWSYVAMTYDGSSVKSYINGVLGDVYDASGNINNTTYQNALRIGARGAPSSPSSFFPGSIDEVRISNVARTPEEIKANSQKRPYGVYTSDVIDLTEDITSIDDIQWIESGVNTGDGETPFSTTDLVAQWDFNETSGTTADNEGSCGASCDGTLTNMTTTGQDNGIRTGWTAVNSKWGGGAVMFDGSNDYINSGSSSVLRPTDALTIEVWVKTLKSSENQFLISTGRDYYCSGYGLRIYNNDIEFLVNTDDVDNGCEVESASGDNLIENGEWNYIVGTYTTTDGAKVYVNGVLVDSDPAAGDIVYRSGQGDNFIIGMLSYESGSSNYLPFKGSMDSLRIYSRALSSSEILSNYNSTNIEFLTRTSTDGNTWEEWKPTTGETQLDSLDDQYMYSTSQSGLVSYWPLDNDSGSTIDDVKGSNDGTATGTEITDGVYSNGRGCDGVDDIILTGTTGQPTNNFTISAWFTTNVTHEIDAESTSSTTGTSGQKYLFGACNMGTDSCAGVSVGTNGISVYEHADGYMPPLAVYNGNVPSGWNYVTVVYISKQPRIYLNGRLVRIGLTSPKTNVYAPIQICGGSYGYHNGSVDEVRISNVAESSSDIYKDWLEGSHARSNIIQANSDSVVKGEGTGSKRIEQGSIGIDKDTAAYWHFEETGGSGAYIKDETINNNDGTPTGTSTADGLYGQARSFNGSSYVTIPASTTLNVGDTMTISAWIKPSDTTRRTIYSHGSNASGGFQFEINGSGGVGSFGTMISGYYVAYTGGGLIRTGEWNHIVYTRTGSGSGTHALYLNGVAQSLSVNATNSYTSQTANSLIGGRTTGVQLWNGLIDELFISDVAYTANQVYEIYKSGREEYLNYTFSSADVSSASKLQYYIASDSPGSYIESTVGESLSIDSTTMGYWRFEENAGSGAYIKDSSNNSFGATPTGTTISNGVYGKSRKLNGTSDIMTVAENDKLDPSQITIEAWINPTVLQSGNFVNKGDNSGYRFRTLSGGTVQFLDRGATNILTSVSTITTGKWWYVVVTGDSSGLKIYINGVLDNSNGTAYGGPNTSSNLIFGSYSTGSEYYSGYLDEVRISNIARSSTYIRQEYEKGLRNHPVTIDFGASLDSGNLITGSGDTSFTIDATAKGLSEKGSGIYEGDKIIVKENYNGTEYIAQGIVSSVNMTTGATAVSSWDTGSTFPSVGYSVNADIFKWQKEYMDLSNIRNDDINAVNNLYFRLLDGNEGRNIWVDDISVSTYLTDPNGTANISSTVNRYMQYMAVITTADGDVTPYLSNVTINYSEGPAMEQIMRHGKWFNSSGQKQSFWWVN